jgi:hypothetical protein
VMWLCKPWMILESLHECIDRGRVPKIDTPPEPFPQKHPFRCIFTRDPSFPI